MQLRTHSWPWFLLLSAGCGYVGVDDLEQGQLGTDSNQSEGSGGKATEPSGGESGDGDASNSSGGSSSGGGSPETGGRDGSGGDPVGFGGEPVGTGGEWTNESEVWDDPNRTGCEPFCLEYNASFSTHFFFEQTQVPAPGVSDNGELFVSSDYSNWGERSLGVAFGDSPASAYIPIEIETGLGSWLHVRAWLYVPSNTITGDVGLLEFLSNDTTVARVETHPGSRLSASAPIDDATMMSKQGSYPLDEWFCLRAALRTDDADGSITVEAAEAVVTELASVDTRASVDANRVNFGVTRTGPHQGAGTIYWDSVAIDQDPVDCDTMTAPQSP